jgi:hypothetical protein
MSDLLRIDQDDLFSSKVEDYIEQRSALRGMAEIPPQPLIVRIIYSNYFYLSIACLVGALIAWGIMEPFFEDGAENGAAAIFMFPAVAGFIGMFLGAAEGIMCRNYGRAAISAGLGLLIGFLGGLVALFPTGVVFILMRQLAASFMKNPQPGQEPTGIALLIFMFGRSMAWAIISIPAGLGQGIAIQERKVIVNGVLGAILGGLIGGLAFDPISWVLITADGQALYSRAVGFAVIGLMVGFFVGLVEQFTKSAWLLMRAGPLAGKQFVLYKQPTVLGSSPKADVYLFKDDAIEPRHALIHNRGGRFEIEDCGTPAGTYVNDLPVSTQLLKKGDTIRLGKTVLEFALKETE